jgi:hypothetical protein
MDARVKPAHDEFWMPPRVGTMQCAWEGRRSEQSRRSEHGVPPQSHPVIAGLDPAIHRFGKSASCEARWMRGSSPRMTSYDEFWMPPQAGKAQ